MDTQNRSTINQSISERIEELPWAEISESLDQRGFATTTALLTPDECAGLAALYDDRERFRSRIDMTRFRFGVGEYKYFANPLPPIVAELRAAVYPHLAPIANQWARALGGRPFPTDLAAFLALCHRNGQSRPTPLLLRYETGGYNCMHQDIYGETVFPLQLTCVLSAREIDFRGGEFLLLEQRPRAQSRAEAIALEQGEIILFATRERPVKGGRGYYRVNLRHGVSTILSGRRFSLGVIFHDAK
ncbi:MAG: 2OG-Fe(II) oxygenase [Candidatus Acidiferrales bacterium]